MDQHAKTDVVQTV